MLTRREPPEGWKGPEPCRSPEHNPPLFMVYEPGEYEWICETCGQVQWFTIPRSSCAKEAT